MKSIDVLSGTPSCQTEKRSERMGMSATSQPEHNNSVRQQTSSSTEENSESLTGVYL